MNVKVFSDGRVVYGGKEYRAALGRSGVTLDKREGDWATPAGTFTLRQIWFRPDKIKRPQSVLPARPISQDDGWCDDTNHPQTYNRHVKLPHEGSYENLWRPDDDLYDLFVETGYNDNSVVPGKGSAIFMHVARPEFTPTAGCIALSKADLTELLAGIGPGTKIEIHAQAARPGND